MTRRGFEKEPRLLCKCIQLFAAVVGMETAMICNGCRNGEGYGLRQLWK